MDRKLLAWGLRRPCMARRHLPRLWLFTDSHRLPDPLPAAARLPRGNAGIVFRHDNAPDRAALGHALARICKARRLILVVAGDARLAAALGAGMHLRGGRWPGPVRPRGIVTTSAHSGADLRRAYRDGAVLAFLSPAFRTGSHPGAPDLGPLRWGALAGRSPRKLRLGALGGIDGTRIRRLPPHRCYAAGAIGALAG